MIRAYGDTAAGVPGDTGPGVAAGGTTGQRLKKTAAGDYQTGWANNPALRVGTGVPAGAPTVDELPFAVDDSGPDYYAWFAGAWNLIVAAA